MQRVGETLGMSRLHLFVSSFENPGVNCLGSSSAWAYRPRPNWLLGTDPWASGSPCRKNTARRQQRCWVHKTANILDKMPKNQGKAKSLIHEMYLAPTRKAAMAAYDQFISSYQIKFLKACQCLAKDKEALFPFYDFPAQHWPHLRTTNPIESTFATARLRTQGTKGCGSRIATLTMVFKLGLEAQKHWRRRQGFELIPKVVTGVRFVDGEENPQAA